MNNDQRLASVPAKSAPISTMVETEDAESGRLSQVKADNPIQANAMTTDSNIGLAVLDSVPWVLLFNFSVMLFSAVRLGLPEVPFMAGCLIITAATISAVKLARVAKVWFGSRSMTDPNEEGS